MANRIKFKAPVLPSPPQQYNQSLFQQTYSILRLYFNQIDNQFRENLNNPTIDGDLTVSGTVTAPTFVGALTGNAATATLASTVTVTDSTANTDFPVAFHNESNALLDDTGVFEYNPSTGTLTTKNVAATSTISVFNSTSNAALLKVGRDDNQDLTIFGDDTTLTIKAAQDSDGNGNHSLILDRVFGGTGLSDFRVRHDGNDEFVISDNGGTVTSTFNSSVVINDNLLEVVSTDDGATEKPVLSLYRNSASPATSDRIGAIRFFGENASGEKVFYAGINGAIGSSVADGSNVGAIHFSLADSASSGNAITDPSADITDDEDPVVSIYKYGLVMRAGNDIFLATQNDCLEWQDTGSHDQKLQGRQTETSGGDSLVSMPDATQGALEVGALATNAIITGTSITHANFTGYRGLKVVFTGSGNCTVQLPNVQGGTSDIGATWTICNAGSANVILDLNGSGTTQTLKILTGASVATASADPHIAPGGVASLICIQGSTVTVSNYILFGSGVVDNS